MRRKSSTPATEEDALKDVELAKKWRDSNAIFKFLNRYKYFHTINTLEKIIEDEEITPEEMDVVKKIVGV